MNLNNIKSLGYSNKELSFIESAVKLHTFTISEISDKTNLKRPTCYLIAEKLEKQQLIQRIPTKSGASFQIGNTSQLEQQEQIRNIALSNLSKILESSKAVNGSVTHTVLFEGKKGAQLVWEKVLKLKTGQEFYFLGSAYHTAEIVGFAFQKYFANKVKKKGIISNTIRIDANFDYSDMRTATGNIWLAHHLNFKDGILIFEKNVGIISNNKNPSVTLIENKNLADILIIMFMALANTLEKK